MKRFVNNKPVHYKPRKVSQRKPYVAKAYRGLQYQIDVLKNGTIGTLLADALYIASNRPGFTRRFLDPLGSKEINAKLEIKKAEHARAREERQIRIAATLDQYFVPYSRNKHVYAPIPDSVMSELGFHKAAKTDIPVIDAAFKEGIYL